MSHSRTIAVLWIALAASLAASWTHLASLFARHEWQGWWPVGAIMATAVDLGILAAMMAVGEMAARGESTAGPRRTVAMLVAMSCAANAAHVWVVGNVGDVAEMVLAVAVAAALPVVVWRLSLILDTIRRPAAVATAAHVAAATASARAPVSRPASARNGAQRPVQPAGDARAAAVATLMASGLSKSQAYRRTREAAAVDVALAASRNGNGHGPAAP